MARPIYTRLGFWIFICAIIIVIVLIAKGCDTGKIDADATPSAESLAPSGEQRGEPSQSQSPSGNTANTNPVSPSPSGTPSSTQDTGETGSSGQNSTAASNPTEQVTQNTESTQGQTEPETSVPTNYFEVHDIGAGVYLIGTDIPAGEVDLDAVSGSGSISTSNGSLSIPTFGNAESYTKTAKSIMLYSGTNITVTGSLTLRISFVTKPEINTASLAQGNTAYTLSAGTYTAGDDFESGTYDFSAVAGYGTVSSSNAQSGGGIDEMMGLADSGGNYSQSVSGISLPAGTVLTVNGCTVKITKRN